MGVKKFVTYPLKKTKEAWEYAKKRSYDSVGDYALGGALVGGCVGAVGGFCSGFGIPLYVGWQIGEYLSDKLDLPGVISFGLDMLTAFGTTALVIGVSIPVLAITGALTGVITGAAGGTVIGAGKKSLEKIASK